MSQIHAEPASGEAAEDKTLGQLVAGAERDIVHLVRSEIDLAKAEITADVKRGGLGGGLLGGAGFFGYVALLFLSIGASLAIAAVLPIPTGFAFAVGFGIIGGLYLLGAALLALIGISNFKKLNKVRRTKQSLQDTMAVLKRGSGEEEEPAQS